jgi:hypothetical protein
MFLDIMVIYLDSIDQSGTDYTEDYTVRGINPIKQCGASVIKDKVKTADTIMLQKNVNYYLPYVQSM